MREPTDEMCRVGAGVWLGGTVHGMSEEWHERMRVTWRAMYDAATFEMRRLLDAAGLIDQICAEEGATVTITGSNPDFGGPNECVTISNSATGWVDRQYSGDTVAGCIRAHLEENA